MIHWSKVESSEATYLSEKKLMIAIGDFSASACGLNAVGIEVRTSVMSKVKPTTPLSLEAAESASGSKRFWQLIGVQKVNSPSL